ncbi:MAG: hypothetical protein IJ688_07205 [Treponema sp.]|nr:hypothetical protein [Treponema sp.]
MNSSTIKHIFSLICALAIFLLSPFFASCRLFTEGNQETVDKLSARTSMKSFDTLKNPLVFTLPVNKKLYLFGNTKDEYPIYETTGNIFAVYDTESNSIYDWAFFEGRNSSSSWKMSDWCKEERYYTSVFQDGGFYYNDYKNPCHYYRMVLLDKTSGKISVKSNKFTEYSYNNTDKFFCHSDYDYLFDSDEEEKYLYKFNIINIDSLKENTIKIKSASYIQNYSDNQNLYILLEKDNKFTVSRLSDDGSSFEPLVSWETDKNLYYDYVIEEIQNRKILLRCYERKSNYDFDSEKRYYCTFNLDDTAVSRATFDIDDFWDKSAFFYKDDLYVIYTNSITETYDLFKANPSDSEFTKIQSFNIPNIKLLSYTKLIDSKLYLITDGNNFEEISIRYVDLESLKISEEIIISASELL